MKGWAPDDSNDAPDLTPMIDVVFLLIVFFLVVAQRMSEQYVEIEKLAISKIAIIEEEPPPRTILSIAHTEEGPQYYWGEMNIYLKDVSTFVKKNKEQKVFLRVDQRITHGIVQEVLREIGEGEQVDVIFGVFQNPVE